MPPPVSPLLAGKRHRLPAGGCLTFILLLCCSAYPWAAAGSRDAASHDTSNHPSRDVPGLPPAPSNASPAPLDAEQLRREAVLIGDARYAADSQPELFDPLWPSPDNYIAMELCQQARRNGGSPHSPNPHAMCLRWGRRVSESFLRRGHPLLMSRRDVERTLDLLGDPQKGLPQVAEGRRFPSGNPQPPALLWAKVARGSVSEVRVFTGQGEGAEAVGSALLSSAGLALAALSLAQAKGVFSETHSFEMAFSLGDSCASDPYAWAGLSKQSRLKALPLLSLSLGEPAGGGESGPCGHIVTIPLKRWFDGDGPALACPPNVTAPTAATTASLAGSSLGGVWVGGTASPFLEEGDSPRSGLAPRGGSPPREGGRHPGAGCGGSHTQRSGVIFEGGDAVFEPFISEDVVPFLHTVRVSPREGTPGALQSDTAAAWLAGGGAAVGADIASAGSELAGMHTGAAGRLRFFQIFTAVYASRWLNHPGRAVPGSAWFEPPQLRALLGGSAALTCRTLPAALRALQLPSAEETRLLHRACGPPADDVPHLAADQGVHRGAGPPLRGALEAPAEVPALYRSGADTYVRRPPSRLEALRGGSAGAWQGGGGPQPPPRWAVWAAAALPAAYAYRVNSFGYLVISIPFGLAVVVITL